MDGNNDWAIVMEERVERMSPEEVDGFHAFLQRKIRE
jgi:hypothetical protein